MLEFQKYYIILFIVVILGFYLIKKEQIKLFDYNVKEKIVFCNEKKGWLIKNSDGSISIDINNCSNIDDCFGVDKNSCYSINLNNKQIEKINPKKIKYNSYHYLDKYNYHIKNKKIFFNNKQYLNYEIFDYYYTQDEKYLIFISYSDNDFKNLLPGIYVLELETGKYREIILNSFLINRIDGYTL